MQNPLKNVKIALGNALSRTAVPSGLRPLLGSNLAVRAVSGVGLVAVLLGLLFVGGAWWHALAALIALGSLHEFYTMHAKLPIADRVIGAFAALVILLTSETFAQAALLPVLGLTCFALYFVELARRQISGASTSAGDVGPIMLGIIYAVLPWYCMIRLRSLPDPLGFAVVLSVFLCTWSCDVFAYLTGSRWGSVKVCPHISPNKSLEGFIGGFAASALCGALCALCFGFGTLPFLVTGLACGTLGQLGDLVESLIKRENGVKDSGNVIPGHGGFLDRFDSVLINALCAWCIWWTALL